MNRSLEQCFGILYYKDNNKLRGRIVYWCGSIPLGEVHLRGHDRVQRLECLGKVLHASADIDVGCGVGCVQVQVTLCRVEVVLRAVAHDIGVYAYVRARQGLRQ